MVLSLTVFVRLIHPIACVPHGALLAQELRVARPSESHTDRRPCGPRGCSGFKRSSLQLDDVHGGFFAGQFISI